MIFNSLDFAIFLPVVFLLYWFAFNRSIRLRNAFVVLASYVFYGWWDWRFLSLIALSTIIDFFAGLQIEKATHRTKQKLFLLLSLCSNLGILGFFKYFDFFVQSFTEAFTVLGYSVEYSGLHIVLPVGISFYTFQTLSYTIDVYRKKIAACHDFTAFAAYVSFFPQLVAGPIERATHLLPQFFHAKTFHYSQSVDGLRQILWGLFKKVVIADNCAQFVNIIFASPESYPGSVLLFGAICFSIQIYGDFSGYSDIAIGTARLFGFHLNRNFAFPYFSRDIAEFWRRWHISLSTWFRDYVYIPLGGSRLGKGKMIRNTLIVFTVSGLWHGANWTFVAWGLFNAIWFLPLALRQNNRKHLDMVAENSTLPSLRELLQMSLTFFLTTMGWVFFRADSITAALHYLRELFSADLFTYPDFSAIPISTISPKHLLLLMLYFFVMEWISRRDTHALQNLLTRKPAVLRYSYYYFLCFLIYWFGGPEQQFIYFQF